MKKYFLQTGSIQEGPFTLEEVKSKGYTEVTPIWYEGLQDWVPAGYIEELKVITPPVYKKQTIISVPATHKAIPEKHKRITFFGIISYVAGALLFLWLGAFVLTTFQENNRMELEKADKAHVRTNLATYVTADRNAYTYYPIGGIKDLEITVTNGSRYSIDEVKVEVDYKKTDGGLFKRETLTFGFMLPQSSQTLPAPNSNRGTSVDYKIVSVKSEALEL